MQWDQAGELITPVRWYFVPPGTPPLPFPHLYGSSNWDTDGVIDLGPGERWDSLRPYSKGQPPGPHLTTGEFCGPLDWWQNGCPSNAPLLPTNLLGQPDCCISDGGLAVGGTSAVYMHPPNKGGLQIGALSTVRLLTASAGGIKPGGQSAIVMHTGGLLVGATSAQYLFSLDYGGIAVGGTSSVTLAELPYGGVEIGGTSSVSLNDNVFGGVEAGGSSVTSIVNLGLGGVEIGAVSVLIFPCQPWLPSPSTFTLYQPSTSQFWTLIGSSSTGVLYRSPLGGIITASFGKGGSLCLGSYDFTFGSLNYQTNSYQLNFLGYDAVAMTGTWVVPSTSPVLAGTVLQLHM
jgi:hypothetical protein